MKKPKDWYDRHTDDYFENIHYPGKGTKGCRTWALKKPCHVLYHLQRLEQLGLLVKQPNNKYILNDEYAHLRSVKLGILTELYVFGRWLIPSLAMFAGYFIVSAILFIVFYIAIDHLVAAIYVTFVLVSASIVILVKAIQIIKSFSNKE